MKQMCCTKREKVDKHEIIALTKETCKHVQINIVEKNHNYVLLYTYGFLLYNSIAASSLQQSLV